MGRVLEREGVEAEQGVDRERMARDEVLVGQIAVEGARL
jgi:hypothetical protein